MPSALSVYNPCFITFPFSSKCLQTPTSSTTIAPVTFLIKVKPYLKYAREHVMGANHIFVLQKQEVGSVGLPKR